jgi:hypothetical protein
MTHPTTPTQTATAPIYDLPTLCWAHKIESTAVRVRHTEVGAARPASRGSAWYRVTLHFGGKRFEAIHYGSSRRYPSTADILSTQFLLVGTYNDARLRGRLRRLLGDLFDAVGNCYRHDGID